MTTKIELPEITVQERFRFNLCDQQVDISHLATVEGDTSHQYWRGIGTWDAISGLKAKDLPTRLQYSVAMTAARLWLEKAFTSEG